MALSPESTHEFEVLGTVFTVEKKYSPIKALGKGAYGVVVAAKNLESGAKVAIKKVCPMAHSRTDALHTLREIRLMRWLGKHPNIIGLKDIMVHVSKDELYIVSTLYDTDLHRIIQSPQPLGEAHYKHFMYQLLRGLRYAHAYGIVHRDIKPANLLATRNCDVCISDFGLARQMPSGPMTEHVVTRWYRAPELMLSADGTYTQAVDIWSAGCVLAELLGRAPLFAGKDFMEVCAMHIDVLGTRPPEELAYIRSDQALQFLAAIPYKPKKAWSSLYPEASEKVLALLDRLLQFHPSKRPSAEDALLDPYFDSVRSQYQDAEPVLPLGPGGFEFSFETDAALTTDDFRRLIVEEAVSLRAEKAMARRMRAAAAGAAPGAAGADGAPPIGVTPTSAGGSGRGFGPADMMGTAASAGIGGVGPGAGPATVVNGPGIGAGGGIGGEASAYPGASMTGAALGIGPGAAAGMYGAPAGAASAVAGMATGTATVVHGAGGPASAMPGAYGSMPMAVPLPVAGGAVPVPTMVAGQPYGSAAGVGGGVPVASGGAAQGYAHHPMAGAAGGQPQMMMQAQPQLQPAGYGAYAQPGPYGAAAAAAYQQRLPPGSLPGAVPGAVPGPAAAPAGALGASGKLTRHELNGMQEDA